MDYKTRKLLEEKARHLAPKWMETGIKEEKERFFGLLTKKQMSVMLCIMMFLLVVADSAIFYLLSLTK